MSTGNPKNPSTINIPNIFLPPNQFSTCTFWENVILYSYEHSVLRLRALYMNSPRNNLYMILLESSNNCSIDSPKLEQREAQLIQAVPLFVSYRINTVITYKWTELRKTLLNPFG